MAGILIIAHAPLASALLDCAAHVFCGCPQGLAAVDVRADADPEFTLREAVCVARELQGGDGVLVLTDIFGATPANVAGRLAQLDGFRGRLRVLAGANLPMLVRALTYRSEPLDKLASRALAGGEQGIFQIGAASVQNQTTYTGRHAADRNDHHQ